MAVGCFATCADGPSLCCGSCCRASCFQDTATFGWLRRLPAAPRDAEALGLYEVMQDWQPAEPVDSDAEKGEDEYWQDKPL